MKKHSYLRVLGLVSCCLAACDAAPTDSASLGGNSMLSEDLRDSAPRAAGAPFAPQAIADAFDMDLLDYADVTLDLVEDGVELHVGYVVFRAGLRTETILVDLEGTCEANEPTCLDGAPAMLRLQHLRSEDGTSVELKRWQHDADTGQWRIHERVTHTVEADQGVIDYSAAWRRAGSLELLVELSAEASSIRAVEDGDEVIGHSPFVESANGLEPVLYEPYHDPGSINTDIGPGDWERPDFPEEDEGAISCYETVQGDIGRELDRIEQLSRELDGASMINWFDPSGYVSPVGGVVDAIKFVQWGLLRDAQDRLLAMYDWLADCLMLMPPPTSPVDPDIPEPPEPGEWDTDQFEMCMICTSLIVNGQEITYWTESPDPDTGEMLPELVVTYHQGDNTCLEWEWGFGSDSDYDGFCDPS